jgi:hypothetical protein
VGIRRQFQVDVTDDIDHLRNSRFFSEQHGKLFEVPGMEQTDFLTAIGGSRRNKRKIDVIEDALLDNVETLDDTMDDDDGRASEEELEPVYSKPSLSARSRADSSDSEVNYSSSDEDSLSEDEEATLATEDESSSSSSSRSSLGNDFESTFGYIYNFPCQMICMEKCNGTLDELFVNGMMDAEQATSALMQVIMTLLTYDKAFGFTHNDLHTNNIMYVETELDYLYYKYDGIMYQVPTYGRIYKIIDFGRSIYTFQKHLFCSDSFFPKGDAATQYNFGPFLNPKKPVLEPNPSFDLCRLGVSIFDFVMDVDLDVSELDGFQRLIRRWCQDDRRHNVLYKKNGDDRYPNFKLYKMISRTVHRHTPQAQLAVPISQQYRVEEVHEEVQPIMDLDALPSYQGSG